MSPTELQPGQYWLQTYYVRVTDQSKSWNIPEIVAIADIRVRTKIVRKVLARHWSEKIDKLPDDYRWSGPIPVPAEMTYP